MPISRRLCAASVALAVAGVPATIAMAQTAASDPGVEFVPVRPGTSDVSPLRADLAVPSDHLSEPLGYSRLYRIDGWRANPWGAETPLFARREGAITAVFPRSVYAFDRFGPYAIVPPATEFYIGEGPGDAYPGTVASLGQPGDGPAPTIGGDASSRVSTRVNNRVDGRVVPGQLDNRASGRVVRRTGRSAADDRARVEAMRAAWWTPRRPDTGPALRYLEWLRDASLWMQAGY